MEEKKRNQCFIFLMVVGTVLLFFPLLTLGIMHNDELLARYWSMRGVKEFLTHSYTTSSGKRTGYVLPGSACDTDPGVYRKIKILLSNLAGSYSYIQYWIICKTDRRDFS